MPQGLPPAALSPSGSLRVGRDLGRYSLVPSAGTQGAAPRRMLSPVIFVPSHSICPSSHLCRAYQLVQSMDPHDHCASSPGSVGPSHYLGSHSLWWQLFPLPLGRLRPTLPTTHSVLPSLRPEAGIVPRTNFTSSASSMGLSTTPMAQGFGSRSLESIMWGFPRGSSWVGGEGDVPDVVLGESGVRPIS